MDAEEEVIKALKEKHPPQAPIQCNVLLQGTIDYVSPSYFDEIDESMIKNAARLTKGAAGPSNLDGEQFKTILVSNNIQERRKGNARTVGSFGKETSNKNH